MTFDLSPCDPIDSEYEEGVADEEDVAIEDEEEVVDEAEEGEEGGRRRISEISVAVEKVKPIPKYSSLFVFSHTNP